MEKLKNIFNPGHKQDEEILYGFASTKSPESPTTGALSGEGSHFQHQKAADSTAQQDADLKKDSLNKDGGSEETRNANTTPLEATSAVSGAGTAHASAPTKGATNAERHTGKLSTPAQPATDGVSAASVRSGVIGEAPQAKTLIDSELPAGEAGSSAPIAAGTAAALASTKDAPSTSKEPTTPVRSFGSEAQVPTENHPNADTWRPDAPTPGPDIPGAFPITPQPYFQDRQLGLGSATIDSVSSTDTAAGDALYEAHRNGSGSAGAPPVPAKEAGSAQADPEHHYARDAAAVGAVGAGVAVAANAAHEDSGPASKTVGKHHSNLANILDPTVLPQPDKQKGHKETVSTETGTGPASKTVGRHSSNIVNIIDPTVLPQPKKQTKHTTSGPHKSDMLNRLDPRVKSNEPKEEQSGHGKEAAAAVGVGAAATGAYAAEKARHESPQTSPTADTTHSPTTQSPMIATTSGRGWHGGPTGTAVSTAGDSPKHSSSSPKSTGHGDASHHAQPHFEPGTAVAGGGALAGAAAVYEVDKHHNEKAEHGSQEMSTGHAESSPTQAASTSPQTATSPDKHHGRDAAVAGAGLAGAGALASKHESNKSDSSVPSGASPKSDKERAKEEKKHEKELAKEAKKREKELAKEQKKAEKEQEKILAKEEKEKKHHHSLLGFLHRDKNKESETQPAQVDGTHEEDEKVGNPDVPSADIPIAGNPTPIRVSSLSGRNRLHKNPPKDFAAKAAQADGSGTGQAPHDELPPTTEYPGGQVMQEPSGGYGYGHDYHYNNGYGYGYSNEEERERAAMRPVGAGNAASTIPDVAGSNAHTAF
ncbi:hypothetical protein HDK77DRAFT_443828 [Phyllosticta capitalensis]